MKKVWSAMPAMFLNVRPALRYIPDEKRIGRYRSIRAKYLGRYKKAGNF
jgi:hypothetical protein